MAKLISLHFSISTLSASRLMLISAMWLEIIVCPWRSNTVITSIRMLDLWVSFTSLVVRLMPGPERLFINYSSFAFKEDMSNSCVIKEFSVNIIETLSFVQCVLEGIYSFKKKKDWIFIVNISDTVYFLFLVYRFHHLIYIHKFSPKG